NIFSTIARDLADLDPQRKHALWLTVKENQRLRVTRAPREQFEKFILMPGKDTNTIGPVVIVIDALDECGDKGSRKYILSILAEAVKSTLQLSRSYHCSPRVRHRESPCTQGSRILQTY